MAGTNILQLSFGDRIYWTLRGGVNSMLDKGDVELPPVGSQSLRRRAIDFLQALLFEYRESEPPSSSRLEDLLGLIGEQLFELAFHGETLNRLVQQLQALDDKQIELLRIELEFVGPEEAWLSTLPWEYIRTPFAFSPPGVFLALLPTEIVLIRRLKVGRESDTRTFAADRPWDTLVICCSPQGDPELAPVDSGYVREVTTRQSDSFRVVDDIRERPPGAPMVANPEFMTVARVGFLLTKYKPHIVHFVGHGRRNKGIGELAFEAVDGTTDWVSDERVALLFARSPNLKLVFLQACESALPNPHLAMSGVAKRVAGMNIPAVVAMQDKVQPLVANTFAEGFYTALAENKSVDLAVKAGRDALNQAGGVNQRMGFGLPVLYLRGDYGGMIKPPKDTPGGAPPAQRRIKCPRCETFISADASFCNNCGLAFTCPEQSADGHPCGMRWDNPLGNRCERCNKRIKQVAWRRPDTQKLKNTRFERDVKLEVVSATGGPVGAAGGAPLAPMLAPLNTQTKT
jgi:CHAT domain-containing protein